MMRHLTAATLTLLIATSLTATAAEAGNWMSWRGPHHSGAAPNADPPLRWSETENIRFKVEVPGRGLASPIVWKDRVFLMSTVPVDASAYAASLDAATRKESFPPDVSPVAQRFVVLAYSRSTGELLWERTALESEPHESHYLDSSWASGSPLTDGKRLYAHFGSNGTYAYDLKGKLLWSVDLGDQTTRKGFGEGSSPAIHKNTLVINWDHEGDSFVVALDAATGKQKWKTARPDEVTSWSTPLIVKNGKQMQVVITATGKSRGYDLRTGEVLWELGGMTVNAIPSPIARDGVVLLTSGYRGSMLQAVKLAGASGDLSGKPAVLWTYEKDTPYVPSPVLVDDRLYFLKRFTNILTSIDVTTGKPLYTQRVEELDSIWSSPVAAGDRVYLFDRDGKTAVLRHGDTYELLAVNQLDGLIDASAAVAGDALFVRTATHLYCIARDSE